jgi:hypothetical protein
MSATGILITNYSVEQVFLGKNFYETATYTNASGSPVTLTIGRTMGRVLATNLVAPQISGSTDGSEMPIGVMAQTYTVAAGATVNVQIVTGGDVNENAVLLDAGDTFATAVRTVSTGGGTIRDLIGRNTTINMYPTTELSNYDNQ